MAAVMMVVVVAAAVVVVVVVATTNGLRPQLPSQGTNASCNHLVKRPAAAAAAAAHPHLPLSMLLPRRWSRLQLLPR